MIKFLLIVNRRGQPRVKKYYENFKQSSVYEAEVIKKCFLRGPSECNFFDHQSARIVYRKYGNLCFITGISEDENELGIWEFIHNIVETFTEYFKEVREIDIMLNIDRVTMILDEMIANGRIVESTQSRILAPIYVMDQAVGK